MKRRALQPHGLRHWYATYLVRNVPNVEIARRQLRHANLATTLQTYVQITAEDEMTAIAGLTNPFETKRGTAQGKT
jgi:integrase